MFDTQQLDLCMQGDLFVGQEGLVVVHIRPVQAGL